MYPVASSFDLHIKASPMRAELILVAAILLGLNMNVALTAQEQQAAPTIDNILQLSGKIDDALIIKWISSSPSRRALTANDLLLLKSKGVSEAVITALLEPALVAPTIPSNKASHAATVQKNPSRLRISVTFEKDPNLRLGLLRKSFLYHGIDVYKNDGVTLYWVVQLLRPSGPLDGSFKDTNSGAVDNTNRTGTFVQLPGAPKEAVCWCSEKQEILPGQACTNGLRSSAGDGYWEKWHSVSSWKTLRYGETQQILDIEITEEIVGADIIAYQDTATLGYNRQPVFWALEPWPAWIKPYGSTKEEAKPGSVRFATYGSRSFDATVNINLVTSGKVNDIRDMRLGEHRFINSDPANEAALRTMVAGSSAENFPRFYVTTAVPANPMDCGSLEAWLSCSKNKSCFEKRP
jgi:hypothetical protein